MALPSFFKRKASPPPAAVAADPLADEAGPVLAARAQARRRLIGAVVLLAVGVVVFPMLFETQPRPLAQNIPIELPKRDAAAPRAPAVPRTTPAVTELPVPEPAEPASAAGAEAPAPLPAGPERPAAPASVAVTAAPAKPVAPAASAVRQSVPAAKAEPARADVRTVESERARAALEDRLASAPATSAAASDVKSGRFVVQVGAYTDATALRDVRAKVEKLGLKTYTQSVDTEAGRRTRVRVGPFATKQEAESASSKLKGAGLPGNVLVL